MRSKTPESTENPHFVAEKKSQTQTCLAGDYHCKKPRLSRRSQHQLALGIGFWENRHRKPWVLPKRSGTHPDIVDFFPTKKNPVSWRIPTTHAPHLVRLLDVFLSILTVALLEAFHTSMVDHCRTTEFHTLLETSFLSTIIIGRIHMQFLPTASVECCNS